MINLRKAQTNESERILQFYQNVIKSIEGTEFRPKWSSLYPDLEYIKNSIENEDLYVYAESDNVIASVVLNSRFPPEYDDISWSVNAQSHETTIIHTFAVDSSFAGKGIGKEIFNKIKETAIENKQKTLRLDIINGNTGAQKVFERFSFEYVDTVDAFHEAVGLEKFHLYELVLEKNSFD